MSLSKQLVLCADDFALHEAASRAIVELGRAGRLSATSAMVLSPRWGLDVALLRELRGALDVGLHLDWTSPFARAAGHGRPLGTLMRRALLGGLDVRQARTVVERQLDAFEAQWKAPPDHVDGHQHVQQFAGIRQALVAALAKRYPGRKPYLRVSRIAGPDAGLKGRVITAMGARGLEKLAAAAGIAVLAPLTGVYDFSQRAAPYGQHMDGWLAALPPQALMMCHPATHVEEGDEIAAARVWEYDYLSSAGFQAALAQAQVRLARGAAAAGAA
jgi:predicted glycoside hydrolase/deacetylase ChbG (UPF0249 family)